jgi:adenosylcobinamide-GDP ribazoletransferase
MAVTAIVLLLLLKFAALSALLQQGAWQALLLAPVLGRVALVAAFLSLPYARSDGLGSRHAKWLPRRAATGLLLLTLLLPPLAMGWTGVAAVVAGAMVFLWLRRAALQRVGGLTGDIAGALCEGVEVASLIACVLLAGSAT